MSYSHKILLQNLLPQSNLREKQKTAQGTHAIVFSLRRLRLTGISGGTLTKTILSCNHRNVNQNIEDLSLWPLRTRHFPNSLMMVSFNRVARRVSLESYEISILIMGILRCKFVGVCSSPSQYTQGFHLVTGQQDSRII